MCACVVLRSAASSHRSVPGGHEDPGGGEGGDPLQVLWGSAHRLHVAQVQETGETPPPPAPSPAGGFERGPRVSCAQIQEGAAGTSIRSTDSSSLLTIASGQQEHCGCYTVELRNQYGLRQAALNLTIVGKEFVFLPVSILALAFTSRRLAG